MSFNFNSVFNYLYLFLQILNLISVYFIFNLACFKFIASLFILILVNFNLILTHFNLILTYFNLILAYFNSILTCFNLILTILNLRIKKCTFFLVYFVTSIYFLQVVFQVCKLFLGQGLAILIQLNWTRFWKMYFSLRMYLVNKCSRVDKKYAMCTCVEILHLSHT